MRTLNTILAIQTASVINMLIFYLGKLPLLRRIFTNRLYHNQSWKKALAILVRIGTTAGGFLLSLCYVGVMIYMPIIGFGQELSEEGRLHLFYHIFFILSFVVSGVSSATILNPKRSKYVAVKLMRMSPGHYMRSTLCFKYVTFFLYTLAAVLVFGLLLGGSIIQLVLISLMATMWRVLFEYIHVKIYEKSEMVLVKQNGIVWLVIGLGFAAAYLPLGFQIVPFTVDILLNFASVAVILALGLWAVLKLARYPDYRTVVDAATQRDDPLLDLSRAMTEAHQTSVKAKDSDYTVGEMEDIDSDHVPGRLRSKQGYAYLNALFFARHRSLVRRPVKIRLAVVTGLGAAGFLATQLFEPVRDLYLSNIGIMLSFMVIGMFYLSVGENLCKAFFYHCDVKLLRYRFYRAEAFQHFRQRLLQIVGRNLLIAVTLATVMTIVYGVAGMGNGWITLDLAMLWLGILGLSVFFSIHHLFMYYNFQPYTTELNMKNPLFHVINMIISGICGFSLFIRVPSTGFAATILAVTLIYLAVALIVVRKRGSQTFRVK